MVSTPPEGQWTAMAAAARMASAARVAAKASTGLVLGPDPRNRLATLLRGGENLKALRSRPGMAWTYVVSAIDQRADHHRFGAVEAYCLFVGHARSGSTLVGSLLSAHPQAVIAHELDTLRFVQWRYTRAQLFHLVLRRDAEFSARGRRHGDNGYDYSVAGSWQGEHTDLRVLGDKKAGATTRKLGDNPELLARLRKTVRVPLRLIHVTRNPYDNIASVARHGRTLAESADRYFARCATLATISKHASPGELIVAHHEDLIAKPHATLGGLARFLGLDADSSWARSCAGSINPSPNRRRHQVDWPDRLVESIAERMRAFDFLGGYAFDEQVNIRERH
ncbi:MAG: sulfotransferase family protein [Acidimicrobiales bacterium]